MMFIGTIVHFIEIILLSLLGIMVYKLVASYRKWKATSVSSSSKGGDRSVRQFTPSQPQDPDYLSVSKITVTEEQSSQPMLKEKPSTVILTDYIGEFFAESKAPDLEPYRAQSFKPVSLRVVSGSADTLPQSEQNKLIRESGLPEVEKMVTNEFADDEFIQVDTDAARPVTGTINQPGDAVDQSIPLLTEYADARPILASADTESDGYITVVSDSNSDRSMNIMSDKVVLAMLEEARVVCAS